MDQLEIARKAIEEEVTTLKAEIERLEAVLGKLDRPTSSTSTSDAPKQRGRPRSI